MASRYLSSLVLTTFFLVIVSSAATSFNVGDMEGWIPNPRESYDNWSHKHTFLVNDTLVFRYNQGQDSVVAVMLQDYNACNNERPLIYMTSGISVFQLPRPGTFYFISGIKFRCLNGEKVKVHVISPTDPSASTRVRASTVMMLALTVVLLVII